MHTKLWFKNLAGTYQLEALHVGTRIKLKRVLKEIGCYSVP
jgi:hypothetical protein